PDRKAIMEVNASDEVVNVPVPEGKDGQCWSLSPHAHGQLWFFNVPNYLAASPAALLLPRELVKRDNLPVPAKEKLKMTQEQASAFAKLALKGIKKEYPNKPADVLNSEAEVKNPRAIHPAFYGCFDWHSSVHGHWMLVRLLRQ